VPPDAQIALAEKLVGYGIPIETVAAALDRPVHTLARSLHHTYLTPEDEQLASGMRQLAWRVQSWAMQVMENGHPDQQMQVVRTVLSKTAGLIGQESTSSYEETQEAISRIFHQMTDVTAYEAPTVLPLAPEDNAETKTPAGRTDYPRQEPPVDEDPVRPGPQLDRRGL
jgi:hypothetical protein